MSERKCSICKQMVPVAHFIRREAGCRPCRAKNRMAQVRGWKARGRCAACGRANDNLPRIACLACAEARRVSGRLCYRRARQTVSLKNRRYYEQQKAVVFDHYGRVCVCCGENNPTFLTLDHINNDGYRMRREGKWVTIRAIWKRAQAGDWPTDLQTLCANCQLGKVRGGGTCVHEAERRLRA